MRRELLAILAIAAACGALAGCGLEQWPYLDPPGDPVEADPLTPKFQLINVTPRDAGVFRGFELYYKFYSYDQGTQQTSESGLKTRADLVAAHYWRMCSDGKLSAQGLPTTPLIDVDAGDLNSAFMTELDFSLAVPEADYQGAVGRTIPIRRYATDTFGFTETFESSELDPTDVDLVDVTWTGGRELYLVVYGFSYGLINFTDQLYSDARYLGYVRYIMD